MVSRPAAPSMRNMVARPARSAVAASLKRLATPRAGIMPPITASATPREPALMSEYTPTCAPLTALASMCWLLSSARAAPVRIDSRAFEACMGTAAFVGAGQHVPGVQAHYRHRPDAVARAPQQSVRASSCVRATGSGPLRVKQTWTLRNTELSCSAFSQPKATHCENPPDTFVLT